MIIRSLRSLQSLLGYLQTEKILLKSKYSCMIDLNSILGNKQKVSYFNIKSILTDIEIWNCPKKRHAVILVLYLFIIAVKTWRKTQEAVSLKCLKFRCFEKFQKHRKSVRGFSIPVRVTITQALKQRRCAVWELLFLSENDLGPYLGLIVSSRTAVSLDTKDPLELVRNNKWKGWCSFICTSLAFFLFIIILCTSRTINEYTAGILEFSHFMWYTVNNIITTYVPRLLGGGHLSLSVVRIKLPRNPKGHGSPVETSQPFGWEVPTEATAET